MHYSNNNPLNIRLSGDKWQGQINGKGNIDGNSSLSSERAGGEAVFCQFYSMEYGWRAAFVILCRTYYGKYGLKTIRGIVSRWAPAKENNTEAYIRHVSDYTGIAPNKVLGSPPRASHPMATDRLRHGCSRERESAPSGAHAERI
jgi:hypothetical protein